MVAIECAVKMLPTLKASDTPKNVDDLMAEMFKLAEQIEQHLLEEERRWELGLMPYDEYLQTPEWQEKRAEAHARADGRCQVCNSLGPLDVHHRTYEHRGSEREDDLIVLCRDCHELFHRFGRLKARTL